MDPVTPGPATSTEPNEEGTGMNIIAVARRLAGPEQWALDRGYTASRTGLLTWEYHRRVTPTVTPDQPGDTDVTPTVTPEPQRDTPAPVGRQN